jgi:hypothetical protein
MAAVTVGDAATINAAVITIYEALLASLIAQHRRARLSLIERAIETSAALWEFPTSRNILRPLHWSDWDMTTPDARKRAVEQLDALLPSEVGVEIELEDATFDQGALRLAIVARRAALREEVQPLTREAASEEGAPSSDEESIARDEAVAEHMELIERLKSAETELDEYGTIDDVSVLTEAGIDRQLFLETPAQQLPDNDGDKGILLLEMLSTICGQAPFIGVIRPGPDGMPESCSPAYPSLSSPEDVRDWTDQVQQWASTILSRLKDQAVTFTELVDAAKSRGYVWTGERDDSLGLSAHVQAVEQQRRQYWDAIPSGAIEYLRGYVKWANGLKRSYKAWVIGRPNRLQQNRAILGVVGGGVAFVAGVVVPLLLQHPPWIVYGVIPVVFYLLVLCYLLITIRGVTEP